MKCTKGSGTAIPLSFASEATLKRYLALTLVVFRQDILGKLVNAVERSTRWDVA